MILVFFSNTSGPDVYWGMTVVTWGIGSRVMAAKWSTVHTLHAAA